MGKQHLRLIFVYKFKGTLEKKMNYPFRGIDKFSCYKTELEVNDVAIDIEGFETKLHINRQDKFSFYDEQYLYLKVKI